MAKCARNLEDTCVDAFERGETITDVWIQEKTHLDKVFVEDSMVRKRKRPLK